MNIDKDQQELKTELENIVKELRTKIRFYLRFIKDNEFYEDEKGIFVIESKRLFDKIKVMYKLRE
jgi:hypothetical protein